MGSANFTNAGLTRQAILHMFDLPKLAKEYFDRYDLLSADTAVKDLTPSAVWSEPIDDLPRAEIRTLFSPEKKPSRGKRSTP